MTKKLCKDCKYCYTNRKLWSLFSFEYGIPFCTRPGVEQINPVDGRMHQPTCEMERIFACINGKYWEAK